MYLKKPHNSKYLKVKLPEYTQEIVIGSEIKNWALDEISARSYSNFILLVDKNVMNIYKEYIGEAKERLSCQEIIIVEPSENSKNLEYLNTTLLKCFKMNLNRKSCIVAIGGGIVGDIAGFFSSVYMRGIDFIFIPTTVMGQADTIINKVGISYKMLKNIIGSFYTPVLTICDTSFIKTLPKKEVSLGFSEIIKHAMIDSKGFCNYLNNNIKADLDGWQDYDWTNIIYKSLNVKSKFVQKDPYDEKGHQKALSYGHTLANAFEGISGYNMRHGEAVALGMQLSALIGIKLANLPEKDYQVQETLFTSVGLKPCLDKEISTEEVIYLLKKDKLTENESLSIVTLSKIGNYKILSDVNPVVIKAKLRRLNRHIIE